MAQPLTAEYRLGLHITVAGLTHLNCVFCEASPSILAASGYFLFDRDGIADLDAGDCAQSFWDSLKGNFDTSVSAPPWLLENRSGSIWNPVASGNVTGAGSNTGDIQHTTQLTVSFRTTDFQRIRQVILESNVYKLNTKYVGGASLAVDWDSFEHRWELGTGGANDPFFFARSKNKKMLAASGSVISATYDLNDKVRRARGVQ